MKPLKKLQYGNRLKETGISLDPSSQIKALGPLYYRKPELDYVFHLFKVQLAQAPNVRLSDEHQSYKWASSKDVEEMPLMAGAMQALHHYRKALLKKRCTAVVNAYLILKEENKVLLSLRQNTGYCDGMWSLVAGHVEEGESATAAMIREAREEIGIEISPSQLKVVHVMHRQSDRLNVDLFFGCSSWQGIIQNREPEKCGGLEFYPIDELPSNMVDYNIAMLKSLRNTEFYSEHGWDI